MHLTRKARPTCLTPRPQSISLKREAGAATLRIAYEKRVPFLYNIDLVGKFDKSLNLSGAGD